MDQLAIQSQGERDQAEARIEGISHEFDDVLGRIELASQQVEALMESSTGGSSITRAANPQWTLNSTCSNSTKP